MEDRSVLGNKESQAVRYNFHVLSVQDKPINILAQSITEGA